jgi:hypothetical protein
VAVPAGPEDRAAKPGRLVLLWHRGRRQKGSFPDSFRETPSLISVYKNFITRPNTNIDSIISLHQYVAKHPRITRRGNKSFTNVVRPWRLGQLDPL